MASLHKTVSCFLPNSLNPGQPGTWKPVFGVTVPTVFMEKPPAQNRPLRLSPPSSSKGRVAAVLNEDDLVSTWEHRLWVILGSSSITALLCKGALAVRSAEALLAYLASAFAGYVLADLGTGFYHWGIGNYGDGSTPIFGSQIQAFQGHHQQPWTITKRQFANNLYQLARPALFVIKPFLLTPPCPWLHGFLGVFIACVVLSQQFHAWAHSKKSEVPTIVAKLQDMGVLLPRRMHGIHHRSPYNVNYCIVSGWWNSSLDHIGIFTMLEKAIYAKWGIKPRSWNDSILTKWKQEGSYFEDGSEIDSSPS